MKLVFLGTGGTYPTKARNVTSIAIQLPGEVVLFDCGEGTQRQLMFSPVSFMKIKRIFISHLHADHFLGLPGLVQSMSLNGREDVLHVFGPKGTVANVRKMLSLGYFKGGFDVDVADLRPGARVDFGNYSVECASATHSVPGLAFSLQEKSRPGRFDLKKAKRLGIPEGPLYRRLQEGRAISFGGIHVRPDQVLGRPRKGLKVVYSGDSRPSPRVTALAKGADALIHDCTLDSSRGQVASDFGHSTAAEAAGVARKAKVRMLFLVHLSPRYEDGSILEREARKVFKNVVAPRDLSEYVIRYGD